MLQDNEHHLFLSKDKQYLTDKGNNIISIKEETEGHSYYKTVGSPSGAYGKTGTAIRPHKVCISWDNEYKCHIWDEVDIRTQWDPAPEQDIDTR
jgi:hypothetical protein